jgi:hypothetical protein
MLNFNQAPMPNNSKQVQTNKEVNKVYRTNDHTRFKKINGNRAVNKLHLNRLIESIKNNDLTHAVPIVVNEQFEIIDGQHRFDACLFLNKPIYYIIVQGSLKEVQILNQNSSNWKSEDYIEGYCDLNMTEYIWFKDFWKTNKISCEAAGCISLNLPHDKVGNIIKSGYLKISDKDDAIIRVNYFHQYRKVYDGAYTRLFVNAIIMIEKIDGFSHEKLLHKLAYQSDKLKATTKARAYIAMLEEIYNYRERNEKLRFF